MGFGGFGSVYLIPTLGFGAFGGGFGEPEIFIDEAPIKMLDHLCNSVTRILMFHSTTVQR